MKEIDLHFSPLETTMKVIVEMGFGDYATLEGTPEEIEANLKYAAQDATRLPVHITNTFNFVRDLKQWGYADFEYMFVGDESSRRYRAIVYEPGKRP